MKTRRKHFQVRKVQCAVERKETNENETKENGDIRRAKGRNKKYKEGRIKLKEYKTRNNDDKGVK